MCTEDVELMDGRAIGSARIYLQCFFYAVGNNLGRLCHKLITTDSVSVLCLPFVSGPYFLILKESAYRLLERQEVFDVKNLQLFTFLIASLWLSNNLNGSKN